MMCGMTEGPVTIEMVVRTLHHNADIGATSHPPYGGDDERMGG